MAYDTKKLSLLVQDLGGGQSLWTLHGSDSIATVLGSGYITDASNKGVKLGDWVLVTAGTLNTAVYTAPTTADYGDANTVTVLAGTELCVVSAISAGAATLVGRATSDVTDNSGGTGNAATGVVANLTKQTVIIPVQLVDLATGTLKIALPFGFTVVGTPQFRVAKPATTASKLATATLQVNGVAATGGVISLTSANCTPMGAAVAASAAVTAGGTGTAGQTVEFALSAVTAFVEGDGYFEVTVTNNDLANAIATLIKF